MRRFNVPALYKALDEQRKKRNMTWKEVASATGIAEATILRTKKGGRMEVDGMLALVSWLERTVESFVQDEPY